MFDEAIDRLKQEVRDLRTAHTRGLGMMNFSFTSAPPPSLPFQYPYVYTIVVTFADSETFPPFCQLSADISSGGFYGATWDSTNLTFTTKYMNADYTDPAPTVKAVASAPISSITVTPVT